jgi:2'-5' RNA ligase
MPPPPLQNLQRQVEENASEIGFARETRAFHPHVTLGRLRRDATSSRLAGLPGVLDGLDFDAEFPVRSIELMQSELSPAGAKYTVRSSIGLSG